MTYMSLVNLLLGEGSVLPRMLSSFGCACGVESHMWN